MKPNHHNDPLDQKIDDLLASRPLRASDGFTERVLALAEANSSAEASKKKSLGALLKYGLPLAAAIALTLSLLQLKSGASSPTLSTAEAQEIFLLEESLSGLSGVATNEFAGEDLLATLDALYLEI